MFIILQSLLFLNCKALSWKCDYTTIDGPGSTHFLYKEENENVVKWLEKYEYCRAKGDITVYKDAGKSKCEYSRNICVFYNDQCILNENRENDQLQECQDLLINNVLSYELDSGRIKEPEPSVIELETQETIIESQEPEPSVTEPCVTELELESQELEPSVTELEPSVTELELEPSVTEPELELEPSVTELFREGMVSAGKSNKISLLIFLLFIV